MEYDSRFSSHWGGSHAYDRKSYSGRLGYYRIPLKGGYTDYGRYFGVGAPLFNVVSNDGEVDFFIRAKNVSELRKLLKSGYPNAK